MTKLKTALFQLEKVLTRCDLQAGSHCFCCCFSTLISVCFVTSEIKEFFVSFHASNVIKIFQYFLEGLRDGRLLLTRYGGHQWNGEHLTTIQNSKKEE
jgi:hypothetical protein